MEQMKSSDALNVLELIGQVTVIHSSLAMNLEKGVSQLLGDVENQNISDIVTADLPISKLINLIGALHNELCKNSQMRKEFNKLLKEIKKINNKRNDIIHKFMMFFPDGNILMISKKMKSQKGLTRKVYIVTKEELEDIVESMTDVGYRLSLFVSKPSFPTFVKE